jgi:Na+/melibiose symporter-like transporter
MFACYWLPGDSRLAAALVMSLAFRLSYALYDIPQNSLLSLATSSERARTNVASMRYVFSGLAALTVAASLAPLLQASAAADRAVRFCIVALAFSVVALMSAAFLARTLRVMRASHPQPESRAKPTGELGSDIRLLIALMFVVSLAAPVFSKLEPYFAAFVLRDPLMGSGVVMAVSIGMTVAQPLWGVLARRTSRLTMIGATASSIVLAASGFLLASQVGGLTLVAAAVAFGAASGGIGMALWAAYGDAVARHAQGREGWAYGLFTASSKLSLAVSGLMIGLLLSRIDYRGADSDLLVSVMVAPSIAAGIACAAIAVSRQLRGRGAARPFAVSGKTSP